MRREHWLEDRDVSVPGIDGPVFGLDLLDFRDRVWRQACFVSSPATLRQEAVGAWTWKPPGASLASNPIPYLEEHWKDHAYGDHNHCHVCWFKFMDIEHQSPAIPGWTDGGSAWLCQGCHDAFAAWWAANPNADEGSS